MKGDIANVNCVCLRLPLGQGEGILQSNLKYALLNRQKGVKTRCHFSLRLFS